MSETRSHNGGELTYKQVLEFIDSREWPVTSKLLADQFDISQQAAYYRLKKLRDRGDVERKKFGKNVVLWRSQVDLRPASEENRVRRA